MALFDTSGREVISSSATASVTADTYREGIYLVTDLPGGTSQFNAAPYGIGQLASGSVAAAAEANHPGIMVISSSASVDSGYALFSLATSGLLIAGGEHYEEIFSISSVTNTVHYIGLIDAVTATAPVDGVFVSVAATTGVMTGYASNNSTTTATGTTYTLSLSTWYRIVVDIASDASSATFSLYNSSGTLLWSDTVASNIPVTAGRETGIGSLHYVTSGGVQEIAKIDWCWFNINRTLTR